MKDLMNEKKVFDTTLDIKTQTIDSISRRIRLDFSLVSIEKACSLSKGEKRTKGLDS